jgi:hypothetical protein
LYTVSVQCFFLQTLSAQDNPILNESNTVSVTLETTFIPKQFKGVVVQQQKTEMIENPKVEKIGDSRYEISFDLPAVSDKTKVFVSAYAESNEGEKVLGEMRQPFLTFDTKKIPPCIENDVPYASVANQEGTLSSLVDIRTARLKVAKNKIAKMLEADKLKNLQDLERIFGLEQSKSLSPNLNPYELIERFSRILIGLKNVNILKAERSREGGK